MKITVIKELRAEAEVVIVESGTRLKDVADIFKTKFPIGFWLQE